MSPTSQNKWSIQLSGINRSTYLTSIVLKFIAAIFAVFVVVAYATPLTKQFLPKQINNNLLCIILSYGLIVTILELFFHFTFAGLITSLVQKKINLVLLVSATFTITIISITGFYAVDSILEGTSQKLSTKQDSLLKNYGYKLTFITTKFNQDKAVLLKEKRINLNNLDKVYQIEEIKDSDTDYQKAIKKYTNTPIRKARSKEESKIEQRYQISLAQLLNEYTTKQKKLMRKVKNRKKQVTQSSNYSAEQFKYLSFVWAIFSIISSVLIGVYEGQPKSNHRQATPDSQPKTSPSQPTKNQTTQTVCKENRQDTRQNQPKPDKISERFLLPALPQPANQKPDNSDSLEILRQVENPAEASVKSKTLYDLRGVSTKESDGQVKCYLAFIMAEKENQSNSTKIIQAQPRPNKLNQNQPSTNNSTSVGNGRVKIIEGDRYWKKAVELFEQGLSQRAVMEKVNSYYNVNIARHQFYKIQKTQSNNRVKN